MMNTNTDALASEGRCEAMIHAELAPHPAHGPAVSWGAVLAGAAAASSLSLVLTLLGTGLGLSAISPWAGQGADASTLAGSAIAWLAASQIVAAGLGGYLAGRLRSRWLGTHVDEVHFRDTAHGLLAWSVGTLAVAGLMASAAGTALGGAATIGAGALSAGSQALASRSAPGAAGQSGQSAQGSDEGRLGYYVDWMFRPGANAAADASAPAAAGSPQAGAAATGVQAQALGAAGSSGPVSRDDQDQARRILARSAANGSLADDDRHYLGMVGAKAMGVDQATAETRASDAFAKMQSQAAMAADKAKAAADDARKAAAHASLWMFVALLMGAFSASLAATFGGRQRDGSPARAQTA